MTVNGLPSLVGADQSFTAAVPVGTGTNLMTVSAADASGNVTSRQYEIDSLGTPRAFTYDANGNLTADGPRTFEWDARNQLLAVNIGTHRSEFRYDGLQRRVREIDKENGAVQSETRNLWCDAITCETRLADGSTITGRRFSQGEASATVNRFFAGDHLASVRAVSDASGGILARYEFDAWGRRTLASGSDSTAVALFGHELEQVGAVSLSLYRAYDPALGRWISEDPLGVHGGLNLYGFVGNAPAGFVDPLGLTRMVFDVVKGRCRLTRSDKDQNHTKSPRPLAKTSAKTNRPAKTGSKRVLSPVASMRLTRARSMILGWVKTYGATLTHVLLVIGATGVLK